MESTNWTVLVIDGDAGIRRTVAALLEAKGHRVIVASDEAEALARLSEAAPDFVLCDPRSIGMSVSSFLYSYEGAGAGGLLILMGPYGEDELALAAIAEGAYDWLPKPFTADELLLTLRKSELREQRLRGG